MSIHKYIINKAILESTVAPPIPGEAPANVSNQPVITEPNNSQQSGPDNGQIPANIYELYPDLVQIDITSPCTLADYFAEMCESQQQQNQNVEFVPSMQAKNTSDEF